MDEVIQKIALTLIPKVGPILAKRLVAYLGGLDAVFSEKKSNYEKVPRIGPEISKLINPGELLRQAEIEYNYMQKHNIKSVFYLDSAYPSRLKECEDAPINLFYLGGADFNAHHSIAIVGTRSATRYGIEKCNEIVHELKSHTPDILIVSGLAYGIDIAAHKAALENKLPTLAVMANGMDSIYPAMHRPVAEEIKKCGALMTEFPSTQKIDAGNFVSRNRIIAGLADCTLVVESAVKGGALITANMANSYNRDVFAMPGRATDKYSAGCNNLIKSNKAALVENSQDIIEMMNWEKKHTAEHKQGKLFLDIPPEDQIVISLLQEHGTISIDELSLLTGTTVGKLSAQLLNIEFNGLIKSLPGKVYCLNT